MQQNKNEISIVVNAPMETVRFHLENQIRLEGKGKATMKDGYYGEVNETEFQIGYRVGEDYLRLLLATYVFDGTLKAQDDRTEIRGKLSLRPYLMLIVPIASMIGIVALWVSVIKGEEQAALALMMTVLGSGFIGFSVLMTCITLKSKKQKILDFLTQMEDELQ